MAQSGIWQRFGIPHPQNDFARNNLIAIFLMGALPAVAGSAISVILSVSVLWALISLATRRFEFKMTQSDRLLAWSMTAFVAAILFTGLIAENPTKALRSVWLIPFLAPWVMIPRMRAAPTSGYLTIYFLGAAVGTIAALVAATIEMWMGASRPEAGAGNAAILSMMFLFLTGCAGLAITDTRPLRRWLALAGVLAGVLGVVVSQTRGVFIALPLTALLLLIYAPKAWFSILLRPVSLGLFAACAAILAATWTSVANRIAETIHELTQVADSGHSANIGERLYLYEASYQAILNSPIWGYGIQNRMTSIIPYYDGDRAAGFSHPHNGFLASALDGGLIALSALVAMLAMPIIIAARAPRDDANYRQRLFMALILVSSYVVVGQTQIMFKHDIMDAFFIFASIMIAVSIPDREKA
jgi:O-antigen ligase